MKTAGRVTAACRQVLAGRRALVAGGVGAVVAIIACNLAWAAYVFSPTPFPGKMSLNGFPGGARAFVLGLLAVTPLLAWRLQGRRRAGLAASLGAAAITGGNLVAIADNGGGLGAVAAGPWLALAGTLLVAAAFAALPDDEPLPDEHRVLAMPIELALIGVAIGTVLAVVVWSLALEESSEFISFLALVAFAVTAAQRLGLTDWLNEMMARRRTVALTLGVAAAAAFPFTQGGNAYWIRVFASIGVFAAAAVGLNVVVGLAGLLDLGYVAFFGVGAYIGGLFANANLTTVHIHLPFLVVILIGASVAALFGIVIGAPTLRLRGDYLAIVTLGFGEIFRITANNWDGLTRGPNGIAGIPDLAVGRFDFGDQHTVAGIDLPGFANYYFAELLLVLCVIVVFNRLNDSRIGRAWVAIREDEVAASAMGVNTIQLKLLAFAIGAFLAGAAGTVNAHLTRQVSPDSYTFLESILFLAAVVLGGMGRVTGALLGSAVLFVVPEKLRAFQDKRLLLFGAALVLMMRFRPEGIVPSRRRRSELRDTDAPVDALDAPPPGL